MHSYFSELSFMSVWYILDEKKMWMFTHTYIYNLLHGHNDSIIAQLKLTYTFLTYTHFMLYCAGYEISSPLSASRAGMLWFVPFFQTCLTSFAILWSLWVILQNTKYFMFLSQVSIWDNSSSVNNVLYCIASSLGSNLQSASADHHISVLNSLLAIYPRRSLKPVF